MDQESIYRREEGRMEGREGRRKREREREKRKGRKPFFEETECLSIACGAVTPPSSKSYEKRN